MWLILQGFVSEFVNMFLWCYLKQPVFNKFLAPTVSLRSSKTRYTCKYISNTDRKRKVCVQYKNSLGSTCYQNQNLVVLVPTQSSTPKGRAAFSDFGRVPSQAFGV